MRIFPKTLSKTLIIVTCIDIFWIFLGGLLMLLLPQEDTPSFVQQTDYLMHAVRVFGVGMLVAALMMILMLSTANFIVVKRMLWVPIVFGLALASITYYDFSLLTTLIPHSNSDDANVFPFLGFAVFNGITWFFVKPPK